MDIKSIIKSEIKDFKTPKDNRKLKWDDLEDDIQVRSQKKDKKFKLGGKWKRFKENREGFKVFTVDGEWVRNNLSVIFGHGGHGLVHEFIPHDEIWIASHHYNIKGLNGESVKCGCNKGNQKVSDEYYDSCAIHEIAENIMMKTKKMNYWTAHNISLDIEEQIGLIPHDEIQ